MDYKDLIRDLETFMPTFGDLFTRFYEQLIAGEEVPGLDMIWKGILDTIRANAEDVTGIFVSFMIIGVLSSVLIRWGDIFRNRQISEMAFYFTYLYGVILLLKVFYVMAETAVILVENIISFTQMLIPAFYIAVAMCYSSVTAGAFYQLNLLLLYAVEIIFPEMILPIISSYVFVSVISGVDEGDSFAGIAGLMKRGIGLLIKICITTVAGLGVIKGLIHPAADNMKYTVLQKTMAAIPGMGDITESLAKMMLGSAILIKNSLGVVILLLMLVLVSGPITKIFLLATVLKISAAGMGIFGEKRLARCADRVAEGGFMLLKSVLAVVIIFFIIIALVTAVAGRGM